MNSGFVAQCLTDLLKLNQVQLTYHQYALVLLLVLVLQNFAVVQFAAVASSAGFAYQGFG